MSTSRHRPPPSSNDITIHARATIAKMTTAPESNPYSEAQAAKAVTALKAHLATQKATSKPSLFDAADESDLEDGTVGVADPDLALWLIVTGKKFFSKDNKKTKQQRIALPNPYLTTPSPTFTVCVITKDPSTYYRSLLPHLPYHPSSLTIISPSKLRTHYKSFESRRQLERSHDLFLADDRVIPSLPNLLGKSIYGRSSKVPIPIRLSKIEPADTASKAKLQEDAEKLQKEIERAVKATYFLLAASASQTIKVGIRAQSPEDVAKNVTAVLEHLTSNDVVKGGWNGVRAVHIKAAETVSLPIWLTERIYDDEDVLGEEEAKRIEYLKTKEGREEHKKEAKEAKKERKAQREERRKNRRHWDSDAESGEDQEFVKKPKKPTAGVKRKADGEIEEPGSAKKTKVQKEVEKAPREDDDDEEEEGGVKLPNPVDLSEQAKRLKIGDKRIAPPAPALETKKGKKGGSSKTAKDKLKRKASKSDLPATKGKKSKAYK
ncbi:hypothetical protein Dda_7795 [Drechslerella dactyloides]|uniref:Ribosomal protein L1 n=1 Tax=Drechslerella dactyloides TaxID=74499 RepID=A0AAD6NG73_DREDA|nr:hypothetical protein Dda_7795 [Drechslerella dactyloides]